MAAYDGMSKAYVRLINQVQTFGETSAPRGIETTEIIGHQFRLWNPADNLPVGANRKLNSKIAYVEALQLVAGRSYPELLIKVAPNFQQFTNGGKWFHGAYGPRIRHQLENMRHTLCVDNDTRQALVTIWDAAYDGHGDVKDTPCTVALQYFIRDGRLHAVTTMRSNDVWWGVPYDVFQFTFLQIQLAHSLSLSLGHYTHQAGSFHLYERDAQRAREVTEGEPFSYKQEISLLPSWNVIRDVAEAILNDEPHEFTTTFGEFLRTSIHG